MNQYGARTPTTPQLSVRNVTQVRPCGRGLSDLADLSHARVDPTRARDGHARRPRDLSQWRAPGLHPFTDVRRSVVPLTDAVSTNTCGDAWPARSDERRSSKVSGLDVDAEYSFHLVAKTTAGTHQSPAVRVRTHSMTNCAGVRVVFGHVDPPELLEQARAALERIGGQSTDKIESLVTTHFVCTASGSSGSADAAYQRALQLSLPTVLPSWLLACDTMQRLAPVQPHYLGTSTATRSTVSVAKPVSSTPNAEPPSVPSGGTSAAATSGGGAVEPASIGASEGTVGSVKAVPPLTSPADPESSGDAAD